MLTVLSKGDDRLDQDLRTFASSAACDFVSAGRTDGAYYHHGDFVVPLTYLGQLGDEIDFRAIGEPLLKVRQDFGAAVHG